MINNNLNALDSIKIINRINSEAKIFKTIDMEPVFELKEEEIERPEKNKKISSSRIRIIKDSKEDNFSNFSNNQPLNMANLHDQIVDTIAEDNNENIIENENLNKLHKKLENFVDKLEDIQEINKNDICVDFDALDIETIKEELNEYDEVFNLEKNKKYCKYNDFSNCSYSQFEDESEKWNNNPNNGKSFISRNYNNDINDEDRIIENINDEEKYLEEN